MPTTTEQTTTISISATGRKLGILNMNFVISILGGLQILAVILSLLVTILLGYSMSGKSGNHALLGGYTFYAIILLVSFWCLLTTSFIYISCAISIVTAVLLPKTIFFILYNGMAAGFYLICSITCLGEASSLNWEKSSMKSQVIGAAVMGIAAGAAHVLITIAGLFVFRKGTSPS